MPTGRVLAPTPALFNTNAIDFEYDPAAVPPLEWLAFLDGLWPDDPDSAGLLQEFMGYLLVADTSQQKGLMVVGPKRSGKGTIGRVMRSLCGEANVAGPTVASLGGTFGLQPLKDKTLAIVSDARFTGEHVGVVVERLLCIMGEDTLTVDCKFLPSHTMKVGTRFVFLTNELPRMTDASGALPSRFLFLRLVNSFYGREDVGLTGRLMAERPGILLWAIEGLKRLRARGHFVQPESGAEAVDELERLSSPVKAFVADVCEVAPGRRIWVDDLYKAFVLWCQRDGQQTPPRKQMFGRDLSAAFPGIKRRRGAGDQTFYEGIDCR